MIYFKSIFHMENHTDKVGIRHPIQYPRLPRNIICFINPTSLTKPLIAGLLSKLKRQVNIEIIP